MFTPWNAFLERRMTMSFVAVLFVCSGTAGGAQLTTPSKHGIPVRACNEFVTTIFVAFAFPEGSDWTSRGWLRVPAHTCKNTRLPANRFSYRAESDWYHDGDHTSRDQWGGDGRFCVADGRFVFHPANRRCPGGQLQKFSPILASDAGVRLTFQSGSTKIRFE
jgi:uncharacterized membrane protein